MAEFGSGNLKLVERSSLDAFSEALRFVHFEKAKEIIDKELEQNKSQLSQSWRSFLYACSELCSLEKSYYSLSHLQHKAQLFSRRDNVREGYRNLSLEFNRVSKASSASVVSHVSDQLVEFVQARVELMDVYTRICCYRSVSQSSSSAAAFGSGSGIAELQQQQQQQQQQQSIDQPRLDAERIICKYSAKFHHPKLAGIAACFEDETEILFHLLNANTRISNLYYMESAISLHEVTTRLSSWQDQSAKYHSEVKRKKKLHKSNQPNLLLWFQKFYNFLLSKYTLCFYNVLVQQCNNQNEILRLAQQRQEPDDLLTRLLLLQRRTDSLCCLLIFDATKQNEPYLGHGYYLPGIVGPHPTGKEGFPVIFAQPSDCQLSSGDMANLLMTIAAFDSADRPTCCFSDDKLKRTYCIGFAHPRLYAVLLLDHQRSKSHKEKQLERSLAEFCSQLAGTAVFALLKSGVK